VDHAAGDFVSLTYLELVVLVDLLDVEVFVLEVKLFVVELRDLVVELGEEAGHY